jgi:nucleotide-binding universal stress UspA family protein
MNKVLIALDYHPVSEQVAEAGYNLAKKLNAEVCCCMSLQMLHITKLATLNLWVMYSCNETANSEEKLNDMQKTGEEFLEKSAAHLKDPSVKTHLAEGKAKDAILDYSKMGGRFAGNGYAQSQCY